jgi:4-hydroxybenzoyl-CoA reductase subunit beta
VLTLPAFEWVRPASLDEALRWLAEDPAQQLVVAGGTDAVPNLKHRLHTPRRIVHLSGLREMQGIVSDADGLTIGALVTLSALADDPDAMHDAPLVADAASRVASPQIRNMGTVGGNLCLDTRCTYYNQTFFWREALGFCLKKDGTRCHVVTQGKRCVAAHSSDVAPALIALGATVEIASVAGRRRVAVDEFFVGDGIHNNVLLPGELVVSVHVPAAARRLSTSYRKLRPRGAIDFPMLSVAFAARSESGACLEARLVVSALGAKPRVVGGTDAVVRGKPLDAAAADALAEAAYKQCRPLTNVPYDADWRHEMVRVFVRRAVRDVIEGSA